LKLLNCLRKILGQQLIFVRIQLDIIDPVKRDAAILLPLKERERINQNTIPELFPQSVDKGIVLLAPELLIVKNPAESLGPFRVSLMNLARMREHE